MMNVCYRQKRRALDEILFCSLHVKEYYLGGGKDKKSTEIFFLKTTFLNVISSNSLGQDTFYFSEVVCMK